MILSDFNINLQSEEELEEFIKDVQDVVSRSIRKTYINLPKISRIYRKQAFLNDEVGKETIYKEALYVRYIDNPFYIAIYKITSRLEKIQNIVDTYWNKLSNVIIKKADEIMKRHINKNYPEPKIIKYEILEKGQVKKIEADLIYLKNRYFLSLPFAELISFDDVYGYKNNGILLYVDIDEKDIKTETFNI